jgi:ORF6N domain
VADHAEFLKRRHGQNEAEMAQPEGRPWRKIRDLNVILDSDLSELYGVTIKRLNEQIRRNLARSPADFMFQITAQEARALRSQNATLKSGCPSSCPTSTSPDSSFPPTIRSICGSMREGAQ